MKISFVASAKKVSTYIGIGVSFPPVRTNTWNLFYTSLSDTAMLSSDPLVAVFLRPLSDLCYPPNILRCCI